MSTGDTHIPENVNSTSLNKHLYKNVVETVFEIAFTVLALYIPYTTKNSRPHSIKIPKCTIPKQACLVLTPVFK